MAAHQPPLSTGFSRQEYWSGLPWPSPIVPRNLSSICWFHIFRCISQKYPTSRRSLSWVPCSEDLSSYNPCNPPEPLQSTRSSPKSLFSSSPLIIWLISQNTSCRPLSACNNFCSLFSENLQLVGWKDSESCSTFLPTAACSEHLWTFCPTLPPIYTGVSKVALVVKNPPANAENIRDVGSVPGSGWSSGGGNGNPCQYSCLENPMDRGACCAMGSQRVGRDWSNLACSIYWLIFWLHKKNLRFPLGSYFFSTKF